MIKRIGRQVAYARRVCGSFFRVGKQTLPIDNRVYLRKRTREERMGARTDVLDRPSVLCSILCLYSLKE